MNLQEKLWQWENLTLAYQNASRGKRGRSATAESDSYVRLHAFAYLPEMQHGYGCVVEAFKDGAGNALAFRERSRI